MFHLLFVVFFKCRIIFILNSHFRNNTWSFVSHAITQQTRFLTSQWTLTCLLLRPTWFVETGRWGWSWCWGQESGLNHTVTAVVGISFLWSLDAVSEVCVYNALLPADCVFCSQWPTLDKPHTKPLVGHFRLQDNCTGCSVGGNQSPNNCGPTRQDWNRHQMGWSRSASNYCVINRWEQILIIIWVGLISSARLQCDSLQHRT